jgi:hypothetical protein
MKKKSFRSTWIMSVLVTGLAAFTLYEYKKAGDDAMAVRGESKAFTLDRADITEIVFKRDELSAKLQKIGEEWKMVEPLKDDTESSSIEGFLFQLLSEKLNSFREDKEPVVWANYGLLPPRATIQLMGKGKTESIEISTRNAFDGSFYVRQKDEVFLGSKALAQVAERQPNSFRSRRLWRQGAVNPISISVAGPESYTLTKSGDAWTASATAAKAAKPVAVDGKKISEWLEKLQDLSPNEIVKDQIDPADKANYLLTKPSLSVLYKFKKEDGSEGQWQLILGQDKAEEIFVYTDERPTLYKLVKSQLERVAVKLEFFRETKSPFQLPVEAARQIVIRTDKMFRTFKKTNADWELVDPDKDLDLNREKLVQLLQNVRAVEGLEYLRSSATIEGKPQLEVKDEKGSVVFSLHWGKEFRAETPYFKGKVVYPVKTSLSPEVVAVEKDKIDHLIDSDIIVSKTKKDAEKK